MSHDLSNLLLRGDIGIVAKELVDVAVTAAVIKNTLAVPPRSRVITDVLARELEHQLNVLDAAITETLLLPV